jgi:hypothetical protein
LVIQIKISRDQIGIILTATLGAKGQWNSIFKMLMERNDAKGFAPSKMKSNL